MIWSRVCCSVRAVSVDNLQLDKQESGREGERDSKDLSLRPKRWISDEPSLLCHTRFHGAQVSHCCSENFMHSYNLLLNLILIALFFIHFLYSFLTAKPCFRNIFVWMKFFKCKCFPSFFFQMQPIFTQPKPELVEKALHSAKLFLKSKIIWIPFFSLLIHEHLLFLVLIICHV